MDGGQEMTNNMRGIAEYYLNKVSALEGVSIEQIKGRSRRVENVTARQVVMYLLRKNHQIGLVTIGHVLGGRDHSTVIHGIECVEDGLMQPWNDRFDAVKKIPKYMPESDEFDNWYGDGME